MFDLSNRAIALKTIDDLTREKDELRVALATAEQRVERAEKERDELRQAKEAAFDEGYAIGKTEFEAQLAGMRNCKNCKHLPRKIGVADCRLGYSGYSLCRDNNFINWQWDGVTADHIADASNVINCGECERLRDELDRILNMCESAGDFSNGNAVYGIDEVTEMASRAIERARKSLAGKQYAPGDKLSRQGVGI